MTSQNFNVSNNSSQFSELDASKVNASAISASTVVGPAHTQGVLVTTLTTQPTGSDPGTIVISPEQLVSGYSWSGNPLGPVQNANCKMLFPTGPELIAYLKTKSIDPDVGYRTPDVVVSTVTNALDVFGTNGSTIQGTVGGDKSAIIRLVINSASSYLTIIVEDTDTHGASTKGAYLNNITTQTLSAGEIVFGLTVAASPTTNPTVTLPTGFEVLAKIYQTGTIPSFGTRITAPLIIKNELGLTSTPITLKESATFTMSGSAADGTFVINPGMMATMFSSFTGTQTIIGVLTLEPIETTESLTITAVGPVQLMLPGDDTYTNPAPVIPRIAQSGTTFLVTHKANTTAIIKLPHPRTGQVFKFISQGGLTNGTVQIRSINNVVAATETSLCKGSINILGGAIAGVPVGTATGAKARIQFQATAKLGDTLTFRCVSDVSAANTTTWLVSGEIGAGSTTDPTAQIAVL